MKNTDLPCLDPDDIHATRAALHAYSRILGGWLKSCRPMRKHWWHSSLRPSLRGLTTGVIHAGIDFEIELDLGNSLLQVQTAGGSSFSEPLHGQAAGRVAQQIGEFLLQNGIDICQAPKSFDVDTNLPVGYSTEVAIDMGNALSTVSTALKIFQAGIREESSPVQFWPHHFDLSLLWLPGDQIPGQDRRDAENADKQMNFGFTFGDEMIPEPYFYVTAYPLPDRLVDTELPEGSYWHVEGFKGAILFYRSLLQQSNPVEYLINLWSGLLIAGRKHLISAT